MKKTNNPQNTHSSQLEAYIPVADSAGLSDLQKYTTGILNNSPQWGFGSSKLKIKRHKLDNNTWQLTVVNPKTLKTILQAEGHGDAVFANEDNLARMAETLMAQGLKIRTQFND
ncbi:MAG: hypothetical protein OQK98_00965 [Gammaproteobacteria bacterium]|nr:hypothetical protein [Gammaproteobacteria bacterium]